MRIRPVALHLLLLVGGSLWLGCSAAAAPPSPKCMELANYSPTTVTPLSFATDIYPILSNTNDMNGCAMAPGCHGATPLKIDATGSRTLLFILGTAPAPTTIAEVKAQLTMPSIHAPAMARVAPGSVGSSFLSYKISGADGLACVNGMCSAAAGIGTPPCGDPMPAPPLLSPLADADRTKILDWIAQGAAD